jgi:hypothetical protein
MILADQKKISEITQNDHNMCKLKKTEKKNNKANKKTAEAVFFV